MSRTRWAESAVGIRWSRCWGSLGSASPRSGRSPDALGKHPPSGGQPLQVAREQRRLPHVGRANQTGDPALETHRKAAMRRHAMFEGFQKAGQRFRVLTAPGECVEIRGVRMQPLPTRHDLQPAEEQVEGVRAFGSSRIWMGIEGTLRQRIPDDEQEVRGVFADRPLAEPALVAWGEVQLADDLTGGCLNQLLGLDEVD